jgi:hypothetical protein
MYSTLKQFQAEHPNELLTSVKMTAFMDHNNIDENEDEFFHPVMKRMLNGEAPIDVELVNSWEDDHVFCCLLMLTYDDETYLVSFWWIDPAILLSFGKMIGNGDRAKQFVETFYEADTLKRLIES